jgi:hypothetical protein
VDWASLAIGTGFLNNPRSEVGDLSNRDIRALAIDPLKPSTIYAGAQQGIFKSTDAGVTWHPLDVD